MVTPAIKREVVDYLQQEYQSSNRKSCSLVGISRRVYSYKSVKDDSELIEVLTDLAQKHPGYGFWKMYHKLRSMGGTWNHKRVYRVYCSLKLNIRRRVKKRLPARVKQPILIPKRADESWSMDFMQDSLYNGSKFRLLNIVDDYNREVIRMEIGNSITAQRVVRVLEQLNGQGRKPTQIRVDNGPEFLANSFKYWCQENGVSIVYIQPGKPTQNSLIERLNGSCRRELLDVYLFDSLQQVENLAYRWQEEYNYHRPHESLGNISPIEYKNKTAQ